MEAEYVIRFGNHWLQTDPMRTKEKWVSDLASASTHPKEWAEKFKADKWKERKQVEVFAWDEALANAREWRDSNLCTTYAYAVEAFLQEHAPHLNVKIPGLNNPGWMFGYEQFFHEGMTAQEYAQKWMAQMAAKDASRKARRRPKKVKSG